MSPQDTTGPSQAISHLSGLRLSDLGRETCAVTTPAEPSQEVADVVLCLPSTPVISVKLTSCFKKRGSYCASLNKILVREQFHAGPQRAAWNVQFDWSSASLIAVIIPNKITGESSPPLTTLTFLGERITEVFFKGSFWGLVRGKEDYIRSIFKVLTLCFNIIIVLLGWLKRPIHYP